MSQRLLDHLKEAGFYSPKDLESIQYNLQKWSESVERGKESHSPELMTLLEARINLCRDTLTELQQSLSKLDPQTMDTYEELVSILRSLSACNTRSKVRLPPLIPRCDTTLTLRAVSRQRGQGIRGSTS